MLHRIIRSWFTGRLWVGCYIWYSEEGVGRAAAPPSPLLAVPNITAHPSTASVPIAVLLYDGPLLCGFNVAIKKLTPLDTITGHFGDESFQAVDCTGTDNMSSTNTVSNLLKDERCSQVVRSFESDVLKVR